MSQPPSAQKVATTSSVRPSSRACVYAAIVARTPSDMSANVVMSEPEVEDLLVERIVVHGAQSSAEFVVRQPGEESVDRALEVRNRALHLFREPHVFEAVRVQAALLAREVREVLRGDRRPARIVAFPH